MSTTKRILFYLLIVVALGGAVWGYFHLKNTKQPSLKAINVMPDSAICILSSNNFTELANKLGNQNLIWNELINIKEVNDLHKHIQFYDSIIGENEVLKDFFKEHHIYLGLYNINSTLNYLITFNLKDLAQQPEFTEALSRSLKGIVKTDYGFEFKVLDQKVILKLHRGVVAISNDINSIELAFGSASKKAMKNKKVASLLDLNKEDDLLNVFIDHGLLKGAKKMTTIDPEEFVLSGHSVYNTEIYPDEITLNGFNIPDSSSLLNALEKQQAQNCDFFGMLPFNTISFEAIGFSDFIGLRKKPGSTTDLSARFWKRVNDSAMFNAEKEFYENINTKVVELELAQSGSQSKALIVEIKDTSVIIDLFPVLSDSMIIFQNIKLAHLDSLNGNIVEAVFGTVFKMEAKYAFLFSNYLVITENKQEAEYYINSLISNSVLTQNEFFADYAKENLGLAFNYIYYSALNKNRAPLMKCFGFLKEQDTKSFDKLSDVCISVANYKNLLQFRANLKYQQIRKNKETPSLWTLEVDTLIQTKVFAFNNHKTGENELLFQDAQNNVQLINATGNVIWKKQINEAVRSEIFTVDAFKNNKFQLLFNTNNYIHLIDRNGNYVPGFPVKLPAVATNKLTLRDYENKKDYRLFIACADLKIHKYNITGAKDEGFTSVKTTEPVTLPIKYVKVGLSDYLLTADIEGQIYVFSRKGEGRIDLKNKLIENCNEFFVDAGSNLKETKLIYLDEKNSLLNKVSLEDKKESLKLANEMEDTYVSFDLIDDDKKTDMMIASKGGLYVYDLSGNRLFNYTEENSEFKNLSFHMDVENTLFLATNRAENEVELLDPLSAKQKSKYPATQDPFVIDLFKDGKKYVLLVNGRTLSCVMLN